MAGISDKALKSQYAENKYRFNRGTELQNKEFLDESGLELYLTDHRLYDPQLGKFVQIDAYADQFENWSPYAFANDDPTLLNDPTGLQVSDSAHPQERAPATVTAHKPNTSNIIYADPRPVKSNPNYVFGKNNSFYIHYTPGGTWDREKVKQFRKMMGVTIALIPVGRGLKMGYSLLKAGQFLRDAEVQAGLESKSLKELQDMVKEDSQLFRQLFGVGKQGAQKVLDNIENVEVPEGLSKESMQAYRELINRVPDPAGTQAVRAQILDKLLKE